MGISIHNQDLHIITDAYQLQPDQREPELDSAVAVPDYRPDFIPHSTPQFILHASSTPDSSPTWPSSIEAWLEHTSAASSAPIPIQSTPCQGLKRKRSTSADSPDIGAHQDPSSSDSMDPNQYGPHAPFTPNRSAATDISTPLTEDSKSTLSSRQTRKDTQFVAAAMQSHRLWQKQRKLFDSFPEFKARVRRVVNEERPSGAKKDSVQKLQEKQEYCQDANEDTILFNLLHLIAKESRQVAKEATVQDGSDQDREKSYEVREFWSDGVVVQVNRLFRNTTLPNAYLQSGLLEDIAKALAKQDGMTQPKPDYIYGIKTDKYLRKDGTQFTDELLDIVPKMHHAFLLVEGKSNKGAMTQGENQACRGGATLVNASRQLLAKLGRVDILGPDKDTFVYSVTMESKVMDVWVHWAEVRMNGKAHEVHFHMNAIASKSLTDDEALPFLRRILHNILDWGCLDRDRMLKEWYQSLDAYGQRLHNQRVADTQKIQDNKKRKTNK